MAMLINPDNKSYNKRSIIKHLPAVNQTETLQKFFGATVDHVFQPGDSSPIDGFVGRKPRYYDPTKDFYLPEPTSDRDFYSLESSVVSVDKDTGTVTNLLFYPDLINYLRANGANVSDHSRLFSQEYYSWMPPIDIDKLINFREYFWIKEGPDVKELIPNATYACDGKTKKYPLPKHRANDAPISEVMVSLNGTTLTYGSDYLLSETHISLARIPSEYSTLVLKSYEPIAVNDIIGKDTFIASSSIVGDSIVAGLVLSSGMKIRLWGYVNHNLIPQEYIVEGVGQSIRLVDDGRSDVIDYAPHVSYVGDELTQTFAIPFAASNGLLVYVNGVEVFENLHYTINNGVVEFSTAYTPKTNEQIDIWELTPCDFSSIISAQQYQLPNASNVYDGMLIRFVGVIVDETQQQYAGKTFLVTGVGASIELTEHLTPWNDFDFVDYFTIERGAVSENAWSQSNRWFHRSVIDLAKVPSTHIITQAKRPIIEFNHNLELFDYGRYRRQPATVLLSPLSEVIVADDGDTTTLNGVSSLYAQLHKKDAVIIDNVTLKVGDTVLVTSDNDDLINNRVYLVSRTTLGKLRFTLLMDGTGDSGEPVFGEIIKINTGIKADQELFWNGLVWKDAQRKTNLNQVPLFQLYDINGNPLSDTELYPNSDFAGNPIFGYKFSANVRTKPDTVLGRRLMFESNGAVSEILFENYLFTIDFSGGVDELNNTHHKSNRYTYAHGDIPGYYCYKMLGDVDALGNGWHISPNKSWQAVTTTVVVTADGDFSTMLPADYTDFTTISVTVNGTTTDNFTVANGMVYIPDLTVNDVVCIGMRDATTGTTGHYTVPVNLQANSNQQEVTTITRGGFFSHFSGIISNQHGFVGKEYASNNFRDSKRDGGLGATIMQHSAPMKHLMLSASNDDIELLSALRYSQREYGRFRVKVLNKAVDFLRRGVMDADTQSAEEWLTEILRVLSAGKTSDFAFSNNGVAGGDYYIPASPSYLGLYPCYQPERFIDTSYVNTRECIRGHDGSITLLHGDIRDGILLALETLIYNSIQEKFRYNNTLIPVINTASEGKFRRKSASPWQSYQTYRIGAVVQYGKSIFSCVSAHTSSDSFDIEQWVPLATTDYSRTEFIGIYRPMFEKWCSDNGVNNRTNDQYDPDSVWTWNWSSLTDIGGEPLPGHWRGIYQWYYDTSRPHSHPWEMLGLTTEPVWWEQEYGSAPYTKNNTKLWEHLETGYIAGSNETVLEYARPGLSAFIPVDDYGNLVNPFDAGIVDYTGAELYTGVSAGWVVGDSGPIETLWRKSVQYPFDMVASAFLMKPAEVFEYGFDTENLVRANGQIINLLTMNRPTSADITVHNEKGIRRYGFQTWISDYIISRGQDITAKFGDIIRNSDVRLAYKVGGFTDTSSLTISSENFDQIPQEDITVRLYRSPAIQDEFYSGVMIEWTGSGWKVYGYNAIDPVFKIIPSDRNGPATHITLGGDPTPEYYHWAANTYYKQSSKIEYNGQIYRAVRAHTSSRVFENVYWEAIVLQAKPSSIKITEYLRANLNGDIIDIPYGSEFKSQADVYDFLISYQRYLSSRGWAFEEVDSNGVTSDFRKCGRDYLYWSLFDYPAGNFITVSPLATVAKFSCSHGLVQNIEQVINGSYSLLDKAGLPIDPRNTNITRMGDDVTIRAINDNGIYACRLYVSELEHVIIINNRTVFNDIIYDPIVNIRQERLRIQGYRSINWKGRMDAPGYIITDNLLVPNFDKSANNFRRLFDVENTDETKLRDRGRANIGYRNRSYLDNLLLSSTSQFDFYRGMIRQKGSKTAMSKVLRSSHVTGGATVNFMEEWAFRVGTYGANDLRNTLELLVRQRQISNNPQVIRFNNRTGGEIRDNQYDDIIDIFLDDERWLVKPVSITPNGDYNIFANETIRAKRHQTAGPITIGETTWTFKTINDMLTAIKDGTSFTVGDYSWIYRNATGEYDVLRLGKQETVIDAFLKTTDNLTDVNVIVADTEPSILVVEGNEFLPDGMYQLSAPTVQSSTWVRNFSFDDATPTSKSFTVTVDIQDIEETTGVVQSVIIPKDQANELAMIKTITLRTVETDGDNFRGKWVKSWNGTEAETQSTTITSAFGVDYVGQGVAFSLLDNGIPFHKTTIGIITVRLNGITLPTGSYFVSANKEYLFVSAMLRQGSTIQYRSILPTDIIEMDVLSNPMISIGTDNDPQRFIRLADTPDMITPMGGVYTFDIPYHCSINANNQPDLNHDIKLFIHCDGATQGKVRVTIDAVQVGADDQQATLTIPDNTSVKLDDITVNVTEAFDAENVFGNNQLMVGTKDNQSEFIGAENFAPSELHTVGVKTVELTTPTPIEYTNGGSITVKFAQAWSLAIMEKFGFANMTATIAYDYLTTPDEYYRKAPSTYRPGADLTVKINGEMKYQYNPAIDYNNHGWDNLRYNVVENSTGNALVYFGKKIQDGVINGSTFTPIAYNVNNANNTRIYPVPGTPRVSVIRDQLDAHTNDALFVPIIGGGAISEITVTNGGSGYLDGYTEVSIVGNYPGNGAAASAVIVNGEIISITIDNAGSDYLTPPTIIIVDTSARPLANKGSGAAAFATIHNSGISGFIKQHGGEYSIPPTIEITPDNGTNVTAILGKAAVSNVVVVNKGSFVTEPTITVAPTQIIEAEIKAYLDASGRVSTFVITNPGRGYVIPPTIEFYDENTGSSVEAEATINEIGEVTYIRIINKGIGYSLPPKVRVVGGQSAQTMDLECHYGIHTIAINNPGTPGTIADGTYPAVIDGGVGTPLNIRVETVGGIVHSLYAPAPQTNDYTVLPPYNTTITCTEDGFPTDVMVGLTFMLNSVTVLSSEEFLDIPTLVCDSGVELTAVLSGRSVAAIRVNHTGSNYSGKLSPHDLLQIIITNENGTYTLRKLNALNEGYHVINNLIYFIAAPRFGANATMNIVLHNPTHVARTEDVDISTPTIPFVAATTGALQVSIDYSTTCSTLTYLSDLNGNTEPLSEEAANPFANVGNTGITILSDKWESVVFNTITDRDMFAPLTPLTIDDMCIVKNNGAGKWAKFIHNGLSWELVDTEQDHIDYSKIDNSLIYNKKTGRIVARPQLWNPVDGYIPGIAASEITYRLDYDPAYYTTVGDTGTQYDPNQAWGEQQVGMVWWDTSTTIFLDCQVGSDTNFDYRTKYWGKVAPGTSLDFYEWVKSPVKPDSWADYVTRESTVISKSAWYPSGTVKDETTPSWVEGKVYNSKSGLEETFYYFWVKNTIAIPPVPFRNIPVASLEGIITDPKANDLPWFAIIDSHTIMLGNTINVLDDTDTVFQLNWSIGESEGNIHKQWILLREGDIRSPIPAGLWTKMADSLVGWDAGQNAITDFEMAPGTIGDISRSLVNQTPVGIPNGPQAVPDNTLTVSQMVGNQFRPRQTWFNPDFKYVNGIRQATVSLDARRSFVANLNRILRLDEVVFDLNNLSFSPTSPYPVGRVYQETITVSGKYKFILPRNFNTNGVEVTVQDPTGSITRRIYADYTDMIDGINYTIEKVKIAGVTYDQIVFPRSHNPMAQDPKQYSTVIIKSGEYYTLTADTLLDRDYLYTNKKINIGENILVYGHADTHNFWTLWKCMTDNNEPLSDNTWKLVLAQTYDIADFVDEIDWWADGYDDTLVITGVYSTTAHRNAAKPYPVAGDAVKILDDGFGHWMITVWQDDTWLTIAKESHIKQLSSKFYTKNNIAYAGPGYTWDTLQASNFSDIANRDGSWELRIILDNLNSSLVANGSGILDITQANELFFAMVYYVHTTQPFVDWAFKTSFLYIGGYDEPLLATPIQYADQSEELQSYIEEVKPYRVKVRDFVRRLSPPIDDANVYMTDFDKPPMYDSNIASTIPGNDKSKAYRPLVVNPNGDGTYAIPDNDYQVLQYGYFPLNLSSTDLGRQYWNDWLDNSGINPNQPHDIQAQPSAVRTTTIRFIYNRVDDTFGTTVQNTAFVPTTGWDGRLSGWDIPPWDTIVSEANDTSAQWYAPTSGMWKNTPDTLIDGISYRGTVVDGYSFTNNVYDSEIDGGQADQTGNEPDYMINVDGSDFVNPHYDAGHPPELIPTTVADTFMLSVYQGYTPSAPAIVTTRISGLHGVGPHTISGEAQSFETVMVHLDGKYLIQGDDYTISQNQITLATPPNEHSVLAITSFSVGGGTPYQKSVQDGIRSTRIYPMPDVGNIDHSQTIIQATRTNNLVVKNGDVWGSTTTTWSENTTSIAYGNGVYVGVGGVITPTVDRITKINDVVTVTCAIPHELMNGAMVTIHGAYPIGFNGTYSVTTIDDYSFSYTNDGTLPALASGDITITGPTRIIVSPDMVNWESPPVLFAYSLNKVIFANNVFVAIGDNCVILSSSDGVTWSQHSIGITTDIADIAFNPDQQAFIVVGTGIIATSYNNCANWDIAVKHVKLTVGEPVAITGTISTQDITANVGAVLRASMVASGHVGISMGIYDPMYVDIGGNPIDLTDDRPYIWQIDNITVLSAGNGAPDSPSTGWIATVGGGTGSPAKLAIHTVNGAITNITVLDCGQYELPPLSSKFVVSGAWLSELGITPGEYQSLLSVVANATIPANTKVIINGVSSIVRAALDLDGLVAVINKKTIKHNVVAENQNGFLKLSVLTGWAVTPDVDGTFPLGARLSFTFRPAGIPLSEGMDSLLQNILKWENNDLILLNGQDDTALNGVYQFKRGGAGSNYELCNPITGELGVPYLPSFVYDLNDGVGYTLVNDAYSQFIMNLNAVTVSQGTTIVAGANAVIMATRDGIDWVVTQPTDRNEYNWLSITVTNDQVLVYDGNGNSATSLDGYIWDLGKNIGISNIRGSSTIDNITYVYGDGLYYSHDGQTNWKSIDETIGTTILSIQQVNGVIVSTNVGYNTTIKLTNSDYAIIDNVLHLSSDFPVVSPKHSLTMSNLGTIISTHQHFKGPNVAGYTLPSVEPVNANSIMVTVNGVRTTDFTYNWDDGVLTVELSHQPGQDDDVVITAFVGDDPAFGYRSHMVVDSTNVTQYSGGEVWSSGYAVTNSLPAIPASTFPLSGTVIVKHNGLELSPPLSDWKIATSSYAYPISPMMEHGTPIEIYVNGVKLASTDYTLTYHHVTNTIIGFIITNHSVITPGDNITVVAYHNHEYFVEIIDGVARLILVNEPNIDDELTVILFNENTAMGIVSETFEADGSQYRYIIKNQPFNMDHIMVSVNHNVKQYMADYVVNDIDANGWDTVGWGGLEQFGEWYDQISNPTYADYISMGGKPPVWNGIEWVEGLSTDLPYAVVVYATGQIPYTGPTVEFFDHDYIIRGPELQPYSWDTVFTGAEVIFDTKQHQGDIVKITSFSGPAIRSPMSWRYFRSTQGELSLTRIADKHSFVLGHDVPLSNSAVYLDGDRDTFEIANGQMIKLYANPTIPLHDLPNILLPTPSHGSPGVIWIGGERIEYFDIVATDASNEPLIDGIGRYVKIRHLNRGSKGTPYGVMQKRVIVPADTLTTNDGKIFVLPEVFKEIVVKIDNVQVYNRQYMVDYHFPNDVPDDAQYYTYEDGILILSQAIMSLSQLTIIGTVTDYKYSSITHYAGSIAIDGSAQQNLPGPVPVINKHGLGHSSNHVARFLANRSGTK